MKRKQIIIGAMVVLLTTGSPYAWSHPGPHNKPHSWGHAWSHVWSRFQSYAKIGAVPRDKGGSSIGDSSPSRAYVVPEIDAASGTSAIALLIGILLLASERFRFKRS
jgi:hypothetical protein